MSSTITVKFGPLDEGVRRAAWDPWAQAHGLELQPGNGLFYAGQAEVEYRTKREVSFSTFRIGESMGEVAGLALAFWVQFGGSMSASPEFRSFIVGISRPPA